ncbi:hypothetical protein BSKO_05105 [Bryopsis sp. KO-2023]|nr:hypothetical protein BSKO_05105 [Bryopsis sp. KO-2023]
MASNERGRSAERLRVLRQHLVVDDATPDYEGQGITHQPTSFNQDAVWEHISEAPPDMILGITEKWRADPNPKKLNLGVGAYRTEEGEPLVLDVVRKAEMSMVMDPKPNKEYLGIGGNPDLCRLSRQLAFGKSCPKIHREAIATVQSISGSGALRVGAGFLGKNYPVKVVYLPNPSWAPHQPIFEAEDMEIRKYRYYHSGTRGLDFQGMMEDLREALPGAIVVFHACAHNPTGVDPSMAQWEQMLRVVKSKKLLPFFDSAYQGFATGDLDIDAASIRLFANANVDMLLAQSYSKNLGLYGERTGCLSVVCQSASQAKRVESQLKAVIRPMYSNPPRHGAAIASAVLGSPELFEQWKVELRGMAGRIRSVREKLHAALVQKGTPGDWTHILKQIGMFTFTGLSKEQVQYMTDKWHVYMMLNGRISMAGLSSKNCGYLADAIDDAVRNV